MSDLCIMVAPNGARRTPADHPALPVTAADIATTAAACRAAGASALHLHVRDAAMRHTLDPDIYRTAIDAVSQVCPGMPVQTTTEAAGIFDLDTQIAAVEGLRPACLSFALGELMQKGEARGSGFLHWAIEQKIGIQTILYDTRQIHDYAALLDAGRLPLDGPPRLLLVAGRYSATQDSDPAEFEGLYRTLSDTGLADSAVWMVCAFGRGEMACLDRAISLGGHVRVGFENAIVDANGRPARDNAERVALVAGLAKRHGRTIGDAVLARHVLGQNVPGPLLP
ncbi:MAG: 3-keto-5-aminohexanoate cleavage protein [Pararhodobacter sp.]|nr:3-keto-5-aminohexanoate cleavage protein [Pararhodobacter sp.]